MPPRKKPTPDGKIEKAEDKMWKDWFNGIKETEHDKFLQQLGLDNEDIKEWHDMHGKLDKFEEEMLQEAPGKPESKKKK